MATIKYQIKKATIVAAEDSSSVDISYQLILNTDGEISYPTLLHVVASDDTTSYDSISALNAETGGTPVDA